VQQILLAIERGFLEKQEAFMLRGGLGFADFFVHGRLGKLVLKRLIDHAYGRTKVLDEDPEDSVGCDGEAVGVFRTSFCFC